jgi:hypothetical protein
MTLTCFVCGAVIKQGERVIMINPKLERIKHAIKRECKDGAEVEELYRRGYRFE